MEIILLERIAKLGQMGDVVNVKDGFARNFLLPQKKAMRATKANLAFFENQRKEIEANNLERKAEAEAAAANVEGRKVILLRQAGESGQLFGSVSARDVAETLAADGVKVDRQQVVLDRAIKTVGLHDVVIRLHPEVEVSIVANIARSNEEAEHQANGNVIAEEEAPSVEDFFETAPEELLENDDAEEVVAEEDADIETV
ncbi:MAG: 50S ribosomal protein L9 [Kordiimonas sp.]|mgnify:CR=1 FL=1|nr:50S ribosomal protein L9 [Kordiimonas sp.]|tara:strand:- start:658 stop:1257 length:600 start_codon:yes stop_codon:yes gene_type:complete